MPSDERGSSLKEHDYIGLSDASLSSYARAYEPSPDTQGAMEDTDLHLELGLGLGPASGFAKERQAAQKEGQAPRQGAPQVELSQSSTLCGYGSLGSKKWMKRVFSETVTTAPLLKSSETDPILPKQDLFTHIRGSSNPKGPAWLPGDRDAALNNVSVKAIAHVPKDETHHSVIDDVPPAKGQVVGWPPVRSYRRQTLAKPPEMYVKVNMDGITVGRKVDLNAYNSYEGLLEALEEMFQPSNNAAAREHDIWHFLLASDSDFLLTYEDKDGDWMLVGDVPWSMFISTVKRLRITRGSEATGSGTRALEKSRVHGC
ncbi:hypothetical protein KP509_16G003300 [Ceratopteris richardii]|uniref:Auxin-responsive protein n=1 Tax=Ceratopteris richardii TaxID=49495 RepID=A0A8T2T0F0_CERRI|nr:hypothetical protein KP509_16G003300 [Ceratopteris richardii]